MHRGTIFFAALFALAVLCAYPASSFASSGFEVSGWIPYWRSATGTTDALAHLNSLTEINPFGYIVKADGTLYDPMGIDSPPWSTLIAAAKKKKVRVIPTVMWSDTNVIHAVLSHTARRIALEERIAAIVKKEGFDGIDIDFEGKKAEDKNYFSTFLKGLYWRMGNKWVMCSIEARTPVIDRYGGETPPADAMDYANDFSAINKYCDRVRLMTYDQGSMDAVLNHEHAEPYVPIADPSWVSQVVALAEKQISRRKLVIGVATYGYEYIVKPLSIKGYSYDLQWAFDPNYATALAQSLGITPVRNKAGEVSFTYVPTSTVATTEKRVISSPPAASSLAAAYGSTTPPAPLSNGAYNIVWWSDAKAIAQKVALAKYLGLRGVAIFKLDGGEDPNMWNIIP